MSDNVNHPAHYTAGKVECIDAIEAATDGLTGMESYCTGNALKYLWRWKRKNGVEDLKKARWYLDKLISSHEARGPEATDPTASPSPEGGGRVSELSAYGNDCPSGACEV